MEQYLLYFGRRLRELRTNAGLTQAELARQLGVVQGHIGTLEAGKEGRQPSVGFLIQVSQYFGVGLDDLLGIAPPVPSAMDALSPEVRAPIEELIKQLGRKQRGDRWNALSNTVNAVGGRAAVDRASRELGVTVTPDNELEVVHN